MICAQDVFVANDLEVIADICRRRDESEKAGDERRAADCLEHIPIAQDLRERDQVDPLTGIPEIDQHGVNRLVRRNVEIFFVNLLDRFRDDVARRDEHRTENALLRLHAVGQGAVNIL